MTRIGCSIAVAALAGLSLFGMLRDESLPGHRAADPGSIDSQIAACPIRNDVGTAGADGLAQHSFLDEAAASRELDLRSGRLLPRRFSTEGAYRQRDDTDPAAAPVRARVARISALAIAQALASARLGLLTAPSTAPPPLRQI